MTWRSAAAWLIGVSVFVGSARAQEATPPPPEVQRMLDLAKDPEKLREVLTSPERMKEVMASMESETVREYFRDPDRAREAMRGIDFLQLGEVVRSVDPSHILKAMALRVKDRLEVGNDEWTVLGPKIEKLLKAQQEARTGRGGGMWGGRGGGGAFGFGGANAEPTELQKATEELQAASRDPNASAPEVARRLAEFRKARDRARERLEVAEREVRELLTARQEGLLVMGGMLN